MGELIVKGEGAVLGVNLGHPIVTNGDFATRLFPSYSVITSKAAVRQV